MLKPDAEAIDELAKIVHEANRAFCETRGDTSQKPWDKTPKHNKASAVTGIKALIDNPDMTPEDSHVVWVKQKESDGWTYGETKDPVKKTHPSLVPYKDLDSVEKYKDHLFRSIVKGYLDFVKSDDA